MLKGVKDVDGELILSDTRGKLPGAVDHRPLLALQYVRMLVITNFMEPVEWHLPNLRNVDTLVIRDNHSLRDLSIVRNLERVGRIVLVNNKGLQTLSFPALSTCVEIEIERNSELVLIHNMPRLYSMPTFLLRQCPSLEVIDIGHDLRIIHIWSITSCDNLHTLGNFASLQECDLFRIHCPQLRNLVGFGRLWVQCCNFELSGSSTSTEAIRASLPDHVQQLVKIMRIRPDPLYEHFAFDVWRSISSHLDVGDFLHLSQVSRSWYRRSHQMAADFGPELDLHYDLTGRQVHREPLTDDNALEVLTTRSPRNPPSVLSNWKWPGIRVGLFLWDEPVPPGPLPKITLFKPTSGFVVSNYRRMPEMLGGRTERLDLSAQRRGHEMANMVTDANIPYIFASSDTKPLYQKVNLRDNDNFTNTEPLRGIPHLDLSRCTGIRNLEPLQLAQTLKLGGVQIIRGHIDPLQFLANVTEMWLPTCGIRGDVNVLGNASFLNLSNGWLMMTSPDYLQQRGYNDITDVSGLGRVKSLRLDYNPRVIDVSALGQVEFLSLVGTGVRNVSMLGNVPTLILTNCMDLDPTSVLHLGKNRYLDLSSNPQIDDVSSLGSVSTLILSECTGVTDVSMLGNVKELDLRGCTGITDISMLAHVPTLIPPEHLAL